jgi:hypothetical protein
MTGTRSAGGDNDEVRPRVQPTSRSLSGPLEADSHSDKPPRDHLVLVLHDAWLAVDDVVALPRRPLVPAVERHLQAVAERPCDSLHSGRTAGNAQPRTTRACLTEPGTGWTRWSPPPGRDGIPVDGPGGDPPVSIQVAAPGGRWYLFEHAADGNWPGWGHRGGLRPPGPSRSWSEQGPWRDGAAAKSGAASALSPAGWPGEPDRTARWSPPTSTPGSSSPPPQPPCAWLVATSEPGR